MNRRPTWWTTLALLILGLPGRSSAQIPVQGRDPGNLFRVIAVDAMGRIITTATFSGCTVMSPCVFAGTDSGGTARIVRTDASGQEIPANGSVANADGVSNTNATPQGAAGGTLYFRSLGYLYNGTTWDRVRGSATGLFMQGPAAAGAADTENPVVTGARSSTGTVLKDFVCDKQLAFNLSGSGDTEIIPASGATTIKICHLSFSAAGTIDFELDRGTGVNCGTGTTPITGLYKTILTYTFDGDAKKYIAGAASSAVCINQSAAVVTGGIVLFHQE